MNKANPRNDLKPSPVVGLGILAMTFSFDGCGAIPLLDQRMANKLNRSLSKFALCHILSVHHAHGGELELCPESHYVIVDPCHK